ncbi:10029_t:CDS:2 [Dentiscutata erythropus]|uniref:10029_t:CDS:1 n=1 Tax=Dentiscutata erythropus TaxID=1348616 RepID=A0A9N9E721_9GLOM|nr:10029_t:CDS:2 [Dentiscutata erythropus]
MDHTNKSRSYTIAFKLDRQQKSKLEAVKENRGFNIDQARVLSGRGRKPMYSELENELVEYIKKKREEKIVVTTSVIKKKAKELGETLGIRDTKFSRGWCKRFRKWHGFVE